MADYFDLLDHVDVVERLIRREQVIRDRLNGFTFYSDSEFLIRFRLSKDAVMLLQGIIGEMLERKQYKHSTIPPVNQILIALRFFATGCFLKVDADLFGVHQSSVCRIIKRVTCAIASLHKDYVSFPTGGQLRNTQMSFMQHSGIPGIIGAIDCTHIAIQSPGGNRAELFRNRKGYFSINVQAICDYNLNLTNVVARWPGSTHDSRIFENSNICARLERREIDGILIGDNGYPLRDYLITPLLHCNTREDRHFNYALCNARVKIENTFGILKRRFPCLRMQLRLKLETSLAVIVACAVLHNISRDNEVPLPDGEDDGPPAVPVPAPQNPNQGGHARRALLIRNFR